MSNLPETFKNFVAFKALQHLRINGIELTNEELEKFIEDQIVNKTEILKGWMREAMAADAI